MAAAASIRKIESYTSDKGLLHIQQQPAILAALNPLHAWHFLTERGWHLLAAVGAIVLALTGAEALCEALIAEGAGCVYGIPGAQENELWDTFKEKGVPYLLVTHEFSAACMADGYARSTGKAGVLCVVPGPGVTNSLTGLGEALLDSSPIVAIVGDVANGEKAKPFQVHALNQVELLKPVCKCVYPVQSVGQIAAAVRQAFATATTGYTDSRNQILQTQDGGRKWRPVYTCASATAVSRSASHSSSLCPGRANIRSRFTLAKPAARIRS